MKKYIGLLILGLSLSCPVFADWTDANCTNRGGTIIANNEGNTFCHSKATMNWWSAHSWCQKHNSSLASYTSFCGGLTSTYIGAPCPETFPYGYTWISNTLDNGTSYRIDGPNKLIWNDPPTTRNHALCE